MDRVYNVLFVCTHNSARSIMAEAILNRDGAGEFRAHSAGSRPSGEVHPLAIELLQHLGYDTAFARSKSWDEFAGPDAPEMDFIFTVCDAAADETCPVWPGMPATAHWGVPDPSHLAAHNSVEAHVFFADAYRMLEKRIELLVNLPIGSLDRMAMKEHLHRIGRHKGDDAAA